MVWTDEKGERQQTTEKDTWMDAKRTKEKGMTETNLGTGYTSDNARTGRTGAWEDRGERTAISSLNEYRKMTL